MKALSIQQPWASITACGIRDVENRSWRPKANPGKILIHSGSKRRNDDFYGELSLTKLFPIENLMFRGYLSDFKELPTNCVVGVAEIADITNEDKSTWADPDIEWKFKLANAKLFKTPVAGISGRPNFFNVDSIDENNLPETIEIQPIVREGETLIVPVAEGWIPEDHKEFKGEDFGQRILPNNRHLYATATGELIPTTKIRFIEGDKTAEYEVTKMFVNALQDEKGNRISEKDNDGNEVYAETVVYILG